MSTATFAGAVETWPNAQQSCFSICPGLSQDQGEGKKPRDSKCTRKILERSRTVAHGSLKFSLKQMVMVDDGFMRSHEKIMLDNHG